MKATKPPEKIEVTHPEKIVFPADGITKAEVVEHYERVAAYALPHIKQRPLAVQRFPGGIDSQGFFQKDASKLPAWIGRASYEKKGGTLDLAVAESSQALSYLANLGTITFHALLSRRDKPDRPDQMIFDLDPPGSDFVPVQKAAVALRAILADLGLVAALKTTGSKGLHVLVPIRRTLEFHDVAQISRGIARLLLQRLPDTLTLEFHKQNRKGRVFVDTLRNAYAQHAVMPYSLRALPEAPVAAPIGWEELGEGVGPRSINIGNLPSRLDSGVDPWSSFPRPQGLSSVRTLLNEMIEESRPK